MHGHEHLIDMRKRGGKPTMVFLTDFPVLGKWWEDGDYPEICVYHDVPERADMRFLVNLNVTITASTKARAKAFFDVCKAAGAATVSTCYFPTNQDNYFRLYSKDGFDQTTEDKHRYES
jgi:hypothetical protein